MIDFQLALSVVAPGAAGVGVRLPQPTSFRLSAPLSDVGVLEITYAAGAVGADRIHLGVEVVAQVWTGTGWAEPPDCRFLVLRSKADVTDPTGARTWTLPSYGRLLAHVRQWVTTPLAEDGSRIIHHVTARSLAAQLIAEARALGNVPDLFVLDAAQLTAAGWPATDWTPADEAVRPGVDALSVLADMVTRGLCEWVTVGRGLAINRSIGTARPVRLLHGIDIKAAPDDTTIEALAGQVLVAGNNNHFYRQTSPGAQAPWGLWQEFVTAAVNELGALTVFAQTTLDTGSGPRTESTRDLNLTDVQYLPLVHYRTGDTITAPDLSGAPAALRVRQITVSYNQDGYTANLILGDRFAERAIKQAAALKSLLGASSASGGTGTPPAPTTTAVATVPAGATVTSPTVTDPIITGGSWTDPVITGPVATGGTYTAPTVTGGSISDTDITDSTVTDPVVTGGTFTNPIINNPTISGGTITGAAITDGAMVSTQYSTGPHEGFWFNNYPLFGAPKSNSIVFATNYGTAGGFAFTSSPLYSTNPSSDLYLKSAIGDLYIEAVKAPGPPPRPGGTLYLTANTEVIVQGNLQYTGTLMQTSTRASKTGKRIITADDVQALLSLTPVTYRPRTGPLRRQRRAGLIAEQVAAAGMEVLTWRGRDREVKGVAYGDLPVYLLAAIIRLRDQAAADTALLHARIDHWESLHVTAAS